MQQKGLKWQGENITSCVSFCLQPTHPLEISKRKHRQDSMKSLLSNSSSNTGAYANGEDSSEAILLNSSLCFSILFRGDWTLDFMMLPGKSSRDSVLDAIDEIVRTYNDQKRRVSNDVLLLRYYWLDAMSDKVRIETCGHHVYISLKTLSKRFS